MPFPTFLWTNKTRKAFFFIFAFVQMFYFMLYSQLADFRSLKSAFFMCFTMMLNKFNFSQLWVGQISFTPMKRKS